MPELETEQSAELLTTMEEPSPELSPPVITSAVHGMIGVGGVVGRLGAGAAINGVQELPPTAVASLLGRPEYALPANAPQKTRLLTDLQQRYGNAYIQQVLSLVHQERLPARAGPPAAAVAEVAEIEEDMASGQENKPPTLSPAPMATGVEAAAAPAPQPSPIPIPAPEPAPLAPQASVAPAAPQASIAPTAPSAGIPGAVEAPALVEETAAPPEAPGAPTPPSAGAGAAAGATPGAAVGVEEAPAAEEEAPEAVGEEAPAEEVPEEAAEGAVVAEEKAPASPEEDPAFQAVVERSQGVAAQQQGHPSAASQAGAAQAAAAGPPNEVASVAAAGQVGELDAQEPQPFDRATFKAALLQKIADTAPKTLEEADEFKDSGKLAAVKGEMTSKVAEGKEQAQGNIAKTAAETPDTSGIEPKPVTPLEPVEAGSSPADIGATDAAPKAKSASEVSLQEGSQSLDQQMADAEITEEQLGQSNEPSFQSAVESKKTAQTHAQEAPPVYRQEEQGILAGAQGQAQTGAKAELAAMHGERAGQLQQVTGAQLDTQSIDEQRRAEVANHIEAIYQRTKEAVEARLTRLDQEVNQAFDQGAAAAQQAFEGYVEARMDAYKDERYSGVIGKGRWLKDKAFGMPDKVNAFYAEGRELYLRMMDGMLDTIAIIVETGLNEAKAEIARGKQEVQDYVDSLPADLQNVGQEAAQDIQSKFDELEQKVNDKQGELIDSLTQKYQANLAQVDARIEEMKAANRGLVDAAFDAIAGVINTIIELKNMLLNVLSRVADAIGLIIRDPIGFLGNLVSGVMQGLENFISNLGTHLQQGLMDWLFGALGGAGIQMPETFDLKGILSLVLQVLGLTYDNIRARAVQIVGEPVVRALEQAAEIFKILITEGPAGLWNWIKDKVGDLKSMVLDGITNFIMEKIIIAGITWVISLLNPASAFIKACKAIYDIVMFFVTRGSQILTLVNAIIDSITAIAQGSLSVAANAVENALAKAIPVVIGFLAALLGLGGISEKIRSIIEKIRAPINKAIDWVINKAVELVKAAGKWLGFGKEDEKKTEETKDKKTQGEYDGQIGKTVQFTAANEAHRLWIRTNGTDANVMMASEEQPASNMLNGYSKMASILDEEKRGRVEGLIKQAYPMLATLDTKADEIVRGMQGPNPPEALVAKDDAIETDEERFVNTILQIQNELGVTNDPLAVTDGVIRRSFSMGSEAHTLTATTTKGQFEITIASDLDRIIKIALTNAIHEVNARPQFMGKSKIRQRLEHALIISDRQLIWKEWDMHREGRWPEFLDKVLLEIVSDLSDLGSRGITNLNNLFANLKRNNGPYAYLPDPLDVDFGKEFSDTQRTLILIENMKKNGGVIKSDEPPHTVLDDSKPVGHPLKPNIDHIFPRVLGGSNSYSNAQVLAASENLAKLMTVTSPPAYTKLSTGSTSPRVIRRPKPVGS